jgi:SOS-response transcriptional repressor LexA
MGWYTRRTRSQSGCLPYPVSKRKALPYEEKNAHSVQLQFHGSAPSSLSLACQQTPKRFKPLNKQDHQRIQVKSFLQACQFNARFMYNTDRAYAQLTKPLRDLTRKHIVFQWTPQCQQAYDDILQTMTSTTARPFNPSLKTIHITGAGPEGIASSLYQEKPEGTWIPVDHASRALTPCEQKYSQTEKESLAQSWGMNIHRYYLLEIPFDSYTNHQPLIHIYNGKKRGNARIERHRLKVQDFQYTMKYMPWKTNPRDYQSRHPLPLGQYTTKEINDMVIDQEDDLCISKIVTDDLPDAVTLKMIPQATKQDPVMQKLIACIQKGHITDGPALHDYQQVFQELTHWNRVILRGERLLILSLTAGYRYSAGRTPQDCQVQAVTTYQTVVPTP